MKFRIFIPLDLDDDRTLIRIGLALTIISALFFVACAASADELPDESKEYIDCLFAELQPQLEQMEQLSAATRSDQVFAVVDAKRRCHSHRPEFEYESQYEYGTCEEEAIVRIQRGFDAMALELEKTRTKLEVASVGHLRDSMPVLAQFACYPSNDLGSLPLYKDGEGSKEK